MQARRSHKIPGLDWLKTEAQKSNTTFAVNDLRDSFNHDPLRRRPNPPRLAASSPVVMQKILRRTATAERQMARKLREKEWAQARKDRQDAIQEYRNSINSVQVALKDARISRREDWELGPLAPLRDTPKKSATGAYWGTVDAHRGKASYALPEDKIQARVAWAGGRNYLCIKPGDRVVVIEGPYKGVIAPIQSIEMGNATIQLDSDRLQVCLPCFFYTYLVPWANQRPSTQQNITMPPVMVNAQKDNPDVQLIQKSGINLPISNVRLVHPLKDNKTGLIRDVIIKQLKAYNVYHDRPTKKTTWERIVPGLNVEIPWPLEQEEAFEDHPGDTLRPLVEERTFVPTLLYPPMPPMLIDELRNKYSRFRTRHEEEYIAAKENAEREADSDNAKMTRSMMTPLQEYAEANLRFKRERDEPEMTETILEKVGEFMARKRHRSQMRRETDIVLGRPSLGRPSLGRPSADDVGKPKKKSKILRIEAPVESAPLGLAPPPS